MDNTQPQQSSKNILVLAAVVAALGITVAGVSFFDTPAVTPSDTTEVAGAQTFSYQGKEGQTALELLKANFDVETTKYSFGEMVVSINGVKADKDKFWAFYVDDKMSPVGAGEYVTRDNQVLEWRLEGTK